MELIARGSDFSGNEVIESIMSEEKPNQREKINIKYAEARRFIPASVPYEKTGEYILKALEYYHRQKAKILLSGTPCQFCRLA